MKCLVKNCNHSQKLNRNLMFHRFPTDSNRKREWIVACGLENLLRDHGEAFFNKKRICSFHFTPSCYFGNKMLRMQAIPTIFKRHDVKGVAVPGLSHIENSNVYEEVSSSYIEMSTPVRSEESAQNLYQDTPSTSAKDMMTQTSRRISSQTPRKKKLRTALYSSKVKTRRLEKRLSSPRAFNLDEISKDEFLHLAKRFLPEECLSFIEMQIGLKAHTRGNRYSPELKRFALILYFLSRKAYKYLKCTFCLPSISVLHREIGKYNITPGLNDCIFHLLEYKFKNLEQLQKHCTLLMDEVSLKSNLFYNRKTDRIIGVEDFGGNRRRMIPAKNALVLMIKSIKGGWKQPISYYFLGSSCPANDLKTILFDTIIKLETIGIEVNCVVNDQGSNFIQLMDNLDVSIKKPYFEVQGRKIFALYDICHLIKSLRNNLIKYDFHFENYVASWDDIKNLYTDMNKRNLRLCPKLTDKHIEPTNFQKMKVKLATQVFSHSVSSAINTYVSFGHLRSRAAGTAYFLEQINDLFDLLNSSNRTGPSWFKRGYQAHSTQNNLLFKCNDMFSQLRVKTKVGQTDVTNIIKCLKGLQQSIVVLPALFADLRNKGFDFILTRRLNQDALENFFGTIRQQSGNVINPIPIQFERAFKKLLLLQFFNHSGSFNCDIDNFELAMSTNFVQTGGVLFSDSNVHGYDEIRPSVEKLPQDVRDLPHRNACSYISGYIYKKCLKKHSCPQCVEYGKSGTIDETSVFSSFKAFPTKEGTICGNLQVPLKTFNNFIKELENCFILCFDRAMLADHLAMSLKNCMKEIVFEHPCQNFTEEYGRDLFIRMRIYYALKFFNREINSVAPSRNRKMLILKHL